MGDFTQSTDAMVWAEAFQEHKARNQWSIDDIDEGLMVGWFANAMETMSATLKSEVARLEEELGKISWACEHAQAVAETNATAAKWLYKLLVPNPYDSLVHEDERVDKKWPWLEDE